MGAGKPVLAQLVACIGVVVDAVPSLANSMGLTMVAEGIEEALDCRPRAAEVAAAGSCRLSA